MASSNELKERLEAKKAEIEQLEKQVMEQETFEAKVNRLTSSLINAQDKRDEELGALSKKICLRDVSHALKHHFHIDTTYNPALNERTLAEVICLFIKEEEAH